MARLFLGLELPNRVKSNLLEVRETTSGVKGARWQSASQLHLTLVFLGEVNEERMFQLKDALDGNLATVFDLWIEGVGCFGAPSSPRNLWAGTFPEAPVAALHDELRRRLETVGFEFEDRRFRPHITLARFQRHSGSVEALLDQWHSEAFGCFPVQEVALFQSTLKPDGSEYTVKERFPLSEPD
ncbi:MAG: RNA 2',3'-cyclic phosphodiesterase [Gammaproteobacteria bacterium]|nr:MAG: RNA 2',3'-cyclic phosphodiesterase [Gammaproteobacteria bacterium]